MNEATRTALNLFLHQARDGNVDAAKSLAWAAHRDLHEGGDLDDSIRAWLLDGLLAIMNGGDATEGFLLKERKGGNKYKNRQRDFEIAHKVRKLYREKKIKLDDCYDAISKEYCLSVSTVRKIYVRERPRMISDERYVQDIFQQMKASK